MAQAASISAPQVLVPPAGPCMSTGAPASTQQAVPNFQTHVTEPQVATDVSNRQGLLQSWTQHAVVDAQTGTNLPGCAAQQWPSGKGLQEQQFLGCANHQW